MNKPLIVNFVVFASGITIGFLTSKKILEKHYSDIAQEEIDSVKKTFCWPHVLSANDHQEQENISDMTGFAKLADDFSKATVDTHSAAKSKIAYNNITKEKMKDQLTAEIEHHNVFDDYNGEDYLTEISPHIISDTEYCEEHIEYDKISLSYYSEDDTLCDENEEIIDDIENTVGFECFDVLENQASVCVRNDKISTDYEICLIDGSYAKVVHGIDVSENLSPREKYQKRKDRSDE